MLHSFLKVDNEIDWSLLEECSKAEDETKLLQIRSAKVRSGQARLCQIKIRADHAM